MVAEPPAALNRLINEVCPQPAVTHVDNLVYEPTDDCLSADYGTST